MTKYVNSRVVLDKKALDTLNKMTILALVKTGDKVLDYVVDSQVIPFDKGTLQNKGTFVDKSKVSEGHVLIVSSTPYARRLYFHPEYNFKKDNNPHAKGKWLQDWTEHGKYADKVKKAYAHFLKELGGL